MSVLLKVQLANVLSQLSPFFLSLLSLRAVCVRYTAPPMSLLFLFYFLPQVIATVDHKVALVSHFFYLQGQI